MSGTSGTIQTQSQLLLAFEDGQASGSITPQDVRNLIVSTPGLSKTPEFAIPNNLGSIGAGTLTVGWGNGSVQVGTLSTGSTVTIAMGATGLPNTYFCAMTLYIVNNSSGSGALAWASNINYVGSAPQPIPVASVATKFRLESIDGGTTWSLVF